MNNEIINPSRSGASSIRSGATRLLSFLASLDYHPLLLAVFPILGLYNHNVRHVHFSGVTSALRTAIVVTLLMMLVLRFVTGRRHVGELITSAFVILFFSYGHAFSALEEFRPGLIHNRHLTGVWLVLLLAAGWWILFRLKNPRLPAQFLTIAGIALLLISVYQAASFELRRRTANLQVTALAGWSNVDLSERTLPDIYYIILDAHTRSDVLRQVYDYDNTHFIRQLEDLGFYVAECSQTNYGGTSWSLTSSFNLDYLEEVLGDPDVLPDLRYSVVRQVLDRVGYQVVVFESSGLEDNNFNLDADIMLARRDFPLSYENFYLLANLNSFETELVNTTWLGAWLGFVSNYAKYLPASAQIDINESGYRKYWEIMDILRQLDQIPVLESPKFVFVHLLVPHEPYIFHPSGSYEHHDGNEEYLIGYRNNAEFIDGRMPAILEAIIERSTTPPVIVLQGDHGRNGDPPQFLMPILNAYHLPDGGNERLYPSISPVNTFRLVFDTYFGIDYGLLEDEAHYHGEIVEDGCQPAGR